MEIIVDYIYLATIYDDGQLRENKDGNRRTNDKKKEFDSLTSDNIAYLVISVRRLTDKGKCVARVTGTENHMLVWQGWLAYASV